MSEVKSETPGVLFVCVRNKGKSQMAAALARLRGQGLIRAYSAGTNPALGQPVNQESAAAIAEVGGNMSDEQPQGISDELLAKVDQIVVIGAEADTSELEAAGWQVTRWVTDEPSLRGIEGMERMRIIREDIDSRVQALIAEVTQAHR